MFVAAIAVRLIRIGQPFIDPWSWRQSDVAAIARNFYTGGFHFAYPQIDWAGDAAGYVGTEFPILPFIAALIYEVAGVHEWIGRIQAVVFFAASLPFFYLLVREAFDEPTATWSTFFYSFAPLSIATSRAFMPDMPSLSLAMIGLYFYVRWLNTRSRPAFLVAAGATMLALLIKVTTAVVAAPLLYLTWRRFGAKLFRQPQVWLFGAIALLPSTIWYWHAYGIAERFYPHHFFGAGGFALEDVSWYWRIARLTAFSSLTVPMAVLAIIGIFTARREKNARLFHWWAVAMGAFVIAAGWGNRHQWYQLPFVPIAAVFAATACEWMALRVRRANVVRIGIVVLFGAAAIQQSRAFFRPAAEPLRNAGLALQEIAARHALIIVADDGDPTIFYYAQRKGWHFLEKGGVFYGNPLDDAQLIDDYDKLRARGATYLVFPFGTRWWLQYYRAFAKHLDGTATVMRSDPQFVIYRINQPEQR